MLERSGGAKEDEGSDDSRAVKRGERPLSVLGVDPELGFAGGETQVLGLTLELLRAGHRAELACDPRGELYARARASGVVCWPLAIRNAIDIPAALRLRALVARGRYDIVHFHTSRAHSMAPAVGGMARATIVTRRMDYQPNRLVAPYLYNRAVDAVAAISAPVARALEAAGVKPERLVIISSGVDCERFRPPTPAQRSAARARFSIAPGEFAVGTVGALEERKGHRYLLEAIAALGAESAMERMVCLVAGSGSLREELARVAERHGISARVRMLGQVEDSQPLLEALDLFVFPSLKEGLGVAMLEAMASGLTVIASASGGVVDAIEDGVSGVLVPPADAPALAAAITRLWRDEAVRRRIGAAARQRACERFSVAAMARRTMELYRACLGQNDVSGGRN
jgi:glycosyltransferase involved in cell wall biosynthesis